jgi:multicomponent Na+:H+ antiporter subunit D
VVNVGSWLPLLLVGAPLLSGCAIFLLGPSRTVLRSALNLGAAILSLLLVAVMLYGVAQGRPYELRSVLVAEAELALHADPLSLLFVTLSATLWLLTTVYAIAYLEGSPDRSRFFGFFSLCVAATTGIALASNAITFLIFYEALTLATWPLVVHRGTPAAIRGGRMYLAWSLCGGTVLLGAIVWLQSLAGPIEFVERGSLSALDPAAYGQLRVIFALLVAGFGVKAALVPLHSWLPEAMVAPAPVSALLHAVAVVKAGAFGIVRVVYNVYGVEFCWHLGVMVPMALVATVTILYGSIRALQQDDLKRRLAYSTVSQVAYIVLGTAVGSPLATVGGIVHLVHQGVMKITLFFVAGNLSETLEVHRVSDMDGVGHRMPASMAAFTVAALGMIGIPPTAGFVTKWTLGLGAVEAGQRWVVAVLLASTALNATYFLPIVYRAWFLPPRGPWPADIGRRSGFEAHPALLVPPLVTAAATLAFGVLAGTAISPLSWARLVVTREYLP